jgi:hypothetical protein
MKKRVKVLFISILILGCGAIVNLLRADYCVNCSMTFTGICVYYGPQYQQCEVSQSGLMNCCGTFVEMQQ